MSVQIGQKAPNFEVSKWVQGMPTNFDQEKDHIVLVEVFQVNCPGCFLYGIPEAINIYNKYKDQGVRVLGIATAFEDFDKNTVENLELLAKTGETVGETKKALAMYGKSSDGKIPYKIPFPLAMDNLVKTTGKPSPQIVMEFIKSQLPDFDVQPEEYRKQIIARVEQYMMSKEYSAGTFDKFQLRGTPSTILVDRKGILRDVSFGQSGHIESMIEQLLHEG
ncbi:peroxiredoxin family protein [Candidatus Nitrosotenuis aquarius]|uniref:peroxiredoxin family protein n=1 Tax=Candidatus Nitrosotenuis aquarius TaxID=1846278 RepID=UPI000C1DDDC5|nr:redoxin domain-containing protein [Candidatus Nitrosotenuis aquarius]